MVRGLSFYPATNPLFYMSEVDYEVELPPAVPIQKLTNTEVLEKVRRLVQIEQNRLTKVEALGVDDITQNQRETVDLMQSLLFYLENPERLKQKKGIQIVRQTLKRRAA